MVDVGCGVEVRAVTQAGGEDCYSRRVVFSRRTLCKFCVCGVCVSSRRVAFSLLTSTQGTQRSTASEE